MTGDKVIVVDFAPFGRLRLAAILHESTASVELAARRRVDRARNFAFELDRRLLGIRVEVGNGREQRLGAGQKRDQDLIPMVLIIDS